jgi:hypothetical protein
MNSSLRLLCVSSLLAGCIGVAQARIERVVEKSFPVSGIGTLRVETDGGEIRVDPAADGVVKITAREKIRADTDAEADDLLKKLELTFEQSGNDVLARAKYPSQIMGFHVGMWPPVQVAFTVTVPARFATDLRTSGGPITVGDLAGKVVAKTSGGPIKLGKIGASIDAHTSGGSINVTEGQGEMKLNTSGGPITVGRSIGPAELSTSGGGIRIDGVEGSVNAHTSGGGIRATINGPLKSDCVLSTSGGSIRVNVDNAAAFRLDASTSGGGVDAEGLTLTLEKGGSGRSHLAGSVNGGGPLLKLRSSGGGISVHAN